jgi:hypothetical protein
MPTDTWIEERSQIKFWLTKAEKAAFRRACKKARKTQSGVLRETVQVLIADTHHACANVEEAQRKECEICLSRLP